MHAPLASCPHSLQLLAELFLAIVAHHLNEVLDRVELLQRQEAAQVLEERVLAKDELGS